MVCPLAALCQKPSNGRKPSKSPRPSPPWFARSCDHGWIHWAYSLKQEFKRTGEARAQFLLPVVNLFPDEYTLRYNLACYECQLGDFRGRIGLAPKSYRHGKQNWKCNRWP